jgi:hypothetical protein
MNNVKNEENSPGMRHRIGRLLFTEVLVEPTAFIIRTYETGIHFLSDRSSTFI